MYDERKRCLELLGMKPGASVQEIKAAYRDLAKVWHPDRFAHDPRLQEKAQDKLKEINEAYQALISGRYTRSAGSSSSSSARPSTEPSDQHARQSRAQQNGSKYLWPVMILIACAALLVFFVSPRLLRSGKGEESQSNATASESISDEVAAKDEAAFNRKEKKIVEKQKAAAAVSSAGTVEAQAPVRAIPTVTVTIDPTTGQLATAACPIKSSMTYVGGQEPRGYCSAEHRSAATSEAQPDSKKKSRLKSVVNGMAAPARWLKDKVKEPD